MNLALPHLVLAFLRVFLRVSASPRQNHSLVVLLALSATLAFTQQPQQRDLKVERLDTVPSAKPLQIPVSYAVNKSHTAQLYRPFGSLLLAFNALTPSRNK